MRETPRFARNLVPGTRERGHQRRPGRDQRQPVGQLARRIFRGRAVERHQRGRHPWQARDLRPPASGRHRQHLDDIVASGNAVLEALSVHRFGSGENGSSDCSDPAGAIKRSHARRPRSKSFGREVAVKSRVRINILSCRSQAFDGPSTGFPQGGFGPRSSLARPRSCLRRRRARRMPVPASTASS